MKSLMLLWKKIAEESAIRCSTSAALDIKYVESRYEYEGFSFMTITLPTFGKDFEKSLDQGRVDRNLFQGFPWQAGLPRWLGGFLDLVFDRSSGVLLDDPDVDAILAIRQLTLMFGKLLLECTSARKQAAYDQYLQCEQDVRAADAAITPTMWKRFRQMSVMLYGSLFSKMDLAVYQTEMIPKHGPGMTADKLTGNRKYPQNVWPARLEHYFPYGEFCIPNWSYSDQLGRVDFLEPGQELPAKVTLVPKTLKTPRVIAMEPTAMMYSQQALKELFMEVLSKRESPDRNNRIVGTDCLYDMLGFDDQTVNQRLALQGSRNGDLATLDLSEASDRVSNQHVRELLRNHPHLHGAVDACRSRKADVDGKVIRLAKFASMGSALCFPMEAMVFLTMIFLGIEDALSTSLSSKDIYALRGSVRVYGDDIIVPVDYVQPVVRSLESFGIRVNEGKSFWNGKFRESCGKEYYDGTDVSIVRCRRVFPTRREHANEVISLVSLRNQLYLAGYWRTCEWLDQKIRKILRYYPVVLPTSPVLGRWSFLGYSPERIGDALHNPLVKGYVVVAKSPPDVLDDYGALLKYFLKKGDEPSFDEEHLMRAGRPKQLALRLRWSSAV